MKTFVGLLIIATVTNGLELPSSFHICNRTDPKFLECIAKSAQEAVVSMANGLKSFKILPLEPLALDSIKIGESEGSISLKQEYKNIKIHGLTKHLEVKNYFIDFDKVLLQSDAYNPQVDFVADYNINGKILVLPIKGSGKCNITMYNLHSKNQIYLDKYEKNGETYLKVKKYNIILEPNRVNIKFDNLFDGDTILGEQMNRFINENSDLLFKELQSSYQETFGLVFGKIANDIFTRISMNKIFPPA